METFVDFIRNQIVLEVIGRDGLRYMPYLTTLFKPCYREPGRIHPPDPLPG